MKMLLQFAGPRPASWLVSLVLASVLSSGTAARGQALPAAEAAPVSTGFALPTTLGTLNYAVTASESVVLGFYGNSSTTSSTNLSGDLAYISNSRRHPFSAVLNGGYSFGERGEPGYSYVSLSFSQVASIGRWSIVLSDTPSYLPGTPAAGLSGIPGVGDLNVPVSGDAGQGVLTNYSDRVSNTAAVTVSRQLTGKTSLSASGTYSLTRFLSSNTGSTFQSAAGLDSDSESGQGSLSHQINARSSFGASYSYSKSTYPGNNFGLPANGFVSQTVSGQYSYRVNRRLSVNFAAGPQWSTISSLPNSRSTNLFADASASYAGRTVTSGLSFLRSSNTGFGATSGSLADSVLYSASRRFALVWNVSGSASYTRSSSLYAPGQPSLSTNTYVEGIQVSRAIARSLSGFASYTFEDQSSAGTAGVDLFSGRSQVFGFGLTYSPGSIHLGRP